MPEHFDLASLPLPIVHSDFHFIITRSKDRCPLPSLEQVLPASLKRAEELGRKLAEDIERRIMDTIREAPSVQMGLDWVGRNRETLHDLFQANTDRCYAEGMGIIPPYDPDNVLGEIIGLVLTNAGPDADVPMVV